MHRAFAILILILCLSLATISPSAFANVQAAFTVNSTADAADASPGDGVCATTGGVCTLRAAVQEANALAGTDTITLPAGTYTLNLLGAGENAAATGDLDVTQDLTITGAGAGTTVIDGANADRVVETHGLVYVTLEHLTIRNGNPGAGADGGGVRVNTSGRLTLTDVVITQNQARYGGGIYSMGSVTGSDSTVSLNSGQGIHNNGGSLTLTNVQVLNNTGWGVYNYGGPLSFNGGRVDGNQGGVYNAEYIGTSTLSNLAISQNTNSGVSNYGSLNTVRLSISNSAILTNTAASGAGVLNTGLGGVATITNSTIADNTATANGGGIFNSGGELTVTYSVLHHNTANAGGGAYNSQGSFSFRNTTFSANAVNDNGGGFYAAGDLGGTLSSVTFSDNAAQGAGGAVFAETSVVFTNSILANSLAGGNCAWDTVSGVGSSGYNLSSDGTCNFHAVGDRNNTDPLLGPLQNNGGPTDTHALLPGSPAIDTGGSCPSDDQRHVTRPADGDGNGNAVCDTGAYEATPPPPAPTLGIQLSGSDVVLTWTAVSGASYEVWRAANSPYFAPGVACAAPDCTAVTTTTWSHTGAANNVADNFVYVVIAVTAAGRSAPSNRVGEFDFALTPGGTNRAAHE